MIKNLTIKNFQSHENTTIHFSEHFNLIIGLSNSGKSSIIRALGVIVNNNWNKQMVRRGCNSCIVKVQTDKGWVQCERGQKINKWECQLKDNEIQYYKNVGTSVPDLVTEILGMGERERGNDLKELPNFQFQLERHYMLSQVGDKKATSNMIARMMDNAIGLGGMEELIKSFSTDLLKDKKWLTDKQNEVMQLKSSVLDKSIFIKYEELMNNINDLYEKSKKIYDNIEIADKYYVDYKKVNQKKQILDKTINDLSQINKINELKEKIIELQQKIKLFNKSFELLKQKEKLQKHKNIPIDRMNDLIQKCIKNKKIYDYCIQAFDLKKRFDKLNEIKNVSMIQIMDKIKEINSLKNKIMEASNELNNARELWKRKNSEQKKYNMFEKDLTNTKNEFEKLKKELGFCPLCGKKLD